MNLRNTSADRIATVLAGLDLAAWQRDGVLHLLWFHSRAPQCSGPNRSTTTRRALFGTYDDELRSIEVLP